MNRRLRRALKIAVIVFGIFTFLIILMYLFGRCSTASEWESKLVKRTPEQMLGIMNAMTQYNKEPPNFMPQSALDDEMCALAVCNAVNFVLGEERLKSSPAWLFSKVNEDKIEVVFDRSEDFVIQGDRIIEIKDSRVWLSEIIAKHDPRGMYIIGYHYHETRSDEKIIAAEADKNSHLMFLLNTEKDYLWGYHLLHYNDRETDPKRAHEYPVYVEKINRMPKMLDVVYLWKVKGVTLPKKGANIFLLSDALPYHKVKNWIDSSPVGEYYVDTAMVWLMNLVNGTEQFPRVVDLGTESVVQVPINDEGVFHGKVLGFYNETAIYYHGGTSDRGQFGLEYQCVEFVNRYYVSLGHRNMTKSGHADSYYWNARRKGLARYRNGDKYEPRVNDIMVFDKSNHDGQPGHVAVIVSVKEDEVCIVQQNVGTHWFDCLPYNVEDGMHVIENSMDQVRIPILGWVRPRR